MKRKISTSIKLFILILFVVISTSYVHIIETKSYVDNTNKNVNLSTMALKVEEFRINDIYSVKDTFTGDLTGYGFDCPLCGGTLGCKPSYNIKDGTTTYPDEVYGVVRIVASSKNLPCGSIIKFESKRVSNDPVLAIVLDRGVLGNDIDLLVGQEVNAYVIGRSIITYDVLRVGWGN